LLGCLDLLPELVGPALEARELPLLPRVSALGPVLLAGVSTVNSGVFARVPAVGPLVLALGPTGLAALAAGLALFASFDAFELVNGNGRL